MGYGHYRGFVSMPRANPGKVRIQWMGGTPRMMRRLAQHSEGYVAQKWVPKRSMEIDGASLWTDLRVWAYRGEIFHLSGRASRRSDRLDLAPPGGWLPTYASL